LSFIPIERSLSALDEPSNHLDAQGRQWLVDQMVQHPTGGLIISHDRQLLAHVQGIFMLNQFGMHYYGGNYALYQQQYQAKSKHYHTLYRKRNVS
jgi:ATPase subunit of ABC transporter with duplicated ATPase domains